MNGKLLALLMLTAANWAAEVRVEASCPWIDHDGYTPVVVRIEALVGRVDVRLDASLGDAKASDVVAVEPGRVAIRTLLLPSSPGNGSVDLGWSSPHDRGTTSVPVTIQHRTVDLIALDPAEHLPVPALEKQLDEHVPATSNIRGGYRSTGSSANDRVRRLSSEGLPDRWQGWPAWLTLLTTPDGEAALTSAQREAIVTWTRCGGALFVTDPASLIAWQRLGAQVRLVPASEPGQESLLNRLRLSAGEDGRPNDHQVPGTDSLPTGWFLGLAITFAILAGPLNIWYAWSRRAPHLLLITTPIISLGTCVILIAIALLNDGLGRKRSAVQIAVLDQTAARATAFTAVTWFCGMAPGGFAIDSDDRALPNDEKEFQRRWDRERSDLAIDWTAGQALGSGWIPARVSRQVAFTQPRPERRRVLLSRDADGWRVLNGLGGRITSIDWVAPDGHHWIAEGIADGQQAELQSAEHATLELHTQLARLGLDARMAIAELGGGPNTFIAQLDAPLLPLPGPTADDGEPASGFVVGTLTAVEKR